MDAILNRLTQLYPKAIEPGLDRTLRILHDLNDPHLKLPPVIHIAGTNGKGSTLAFIRAILEARGQTCHVMTSPHLVKFNERIVVASEEINDAVLEKLLTRVEKINAGKPVTFFEITTAAGLLVFAETPADYCLLETGMGGRLDSTNVVPHPAVTIITNISLDHTQYLGGTLHEIAFEKAGIMKACVPCVLGPMAKDILSVFETRAQELNVPLYRAGQEWYFSEIETGFTITLENESYICPKPSLVGEHQITNAAVAAVATLLLPRFRSEGLVGITKAEWPARLQKITRGKLFDILPKGCELWLDGGHNEDGGRILGKQARIWKEKDNKPLHLIIGMLTTKDPEPFYNQLKPYTSSATAIPIADEKLAFPAQVLADRLFIDAAPDVASALSKLDLNKARVLITGSLYLAGNILSGNA